MLFVYIRMIYIYIAAKKILSLLQYSDQCHHIISIEKKASINVVTDTN